jgi:hypothetical protein
MSEENVELVRVGFDAFREGDLSRMLDLMADDLVTYRADPDGATYHGKEGFLRATADWTEGFSEWSVIPERSSTQGSASWCGSAKWPAESAAPFRSRTTSGSSSRPAR